MHHFDKTAVAEEGKNFATAVGVIEFRSVGLNAEIFDSLVLHSRLRRVSECHYLNNDRGWQRWR